MEYLVTMTTHVPEGTPACHRPYTAYASASGIGGPTTRSP
jgi:hypothetical protein